MIKADIHHSLKKEKENIEDELYKEKRLTKSLEFEIDSANEKAKDITMNHTKELADSVHVSSELLAEKQKTLKLTNQITKINEELKKSKARTYTETPPPNVKNIADSKINQPSNSKETVSGKKKAIETAKIKAIETEKQNVERDIILRKHKQIKNDEKIEKIKAGESDEVILKLAEDRIIILPELASFLLKDFSEYPDETLVQIRSASSLSLKLGKQNIMQIPLSNEPLLQDLELAISILIEENLLVRINDNFYKLSNEGIRASLIANPKYSKLCSSQTMK